MIRGQTAVPLVSIQFQMKTLEPAASSLPSVLSGLFWSPLPLRCPTKSAPIYMLSMRGARPRQFYEDVVALSLGF